MQRWPRLDGAGWVSVCPACPPAPAAASQESTPLPAEPPAEGGGTRRFRDLISAPDQPPGQALPEDLLEDLPEQARQLLTAKPAPKPSTGPLPEQLSHALARQGYVVSEDTHGVRLTGATRSGSTGGLSASDVVRMAADLDGGILPTEQRSRCPKCDAVVPRQAARCEWCGQSLTPQADQA